MIYTHTQDAIQKPYNTNIAQQAQSYARGNIGKENQMSASTSYEVPSQLESEDLLKAQIHGGSGYAAATVADPGIEPTAGATGVGKPKRARKKL